MPTKAGTGFGSIQHARSVFRALFSWYNHRQRHTGLGLLTPAAVHGGKASAVLHQRSIVLASAYAAHPERFVRRPPSAGQVPAAALPFR